MQISMINDTWNENEEDLDCRFSSVRAKETTIGNFLTSLIRKEMAASIGVIHSGTIRADKVYNKGSL
jgi:hypothetical protein